MNAIKKRTVLQIALGLSLCLPDAAIWAAQPAAVPVSVSEGTLEIPTYEHVGRETQPPLFLHSTVRGLYPFPSYLAPFTEDSPKPKTYRTVVVENEYLKLTYIPEFGGRIFSLYDKLRKREVFYRNDVIKPTMFNPRFSWPQSGIELTGPYDVHTLTLHGEPFWSHSIVRHSDGSVSLVLGEIDPVYHMRVTFTATLYPGVAAMQVGIFCYNRNDARMPQMFWTNASLPSTEKTRYFYPMTRTVGHTTGEVSDWPIYNGVDYSWDRNNKHMLGVFGIDVYDDFAGAYQLDHNYGVFRFADRRVVQGMKMWTFGYGPGAEKVQESYTDHAGPYVEVQSGRYIWDGHYEWVAPHKVENWSEWWVPVSGIDGLTTMTRDVALNLTVNADPGGKHSEVRVALSPACRIPGAKLIVNAAYGELANAPIDLIPGTPFLKTISGIATNADGLRQLSVRIVDASGHDRLNYLRPDENPGGKQYSAFAKTLESPALAPQQMTVEQLVQAAEYKLKESDPSGMLDLVNDALKLDPGDSRAHLLLGIYDYTAGRFKTAADELTKATERDPYSGESWYYLAISQLAMGENQAAERNLYYIRTESAYFGDREYQLGKLALLSNDLDAAAKHFGNAVTANGYDLDARALLALTLRNLGKKNEAGQQLDALLGIDPSNRMAQLERFFLNRNPDAKRELLRLMGEQTQEALDLAIFYGDLRRWHEASEVLLLLAHDNKDPWGTGSLFYYTLAYDLQKSGNSSAASEYRKRAQAAAHVIDRFPYRRASEAPLNAAIAADPNDVTARFDLGCLLYSLDRPQEAIEQWKKAVVLAPADFNARRELGLAYAEQGQVNQAVPQLEQAIELNPNHIATLNDLSAVYAKAGKFDQQIALLQKALRRTPGDDDLTVALMNAYLIQGRYNDADAIVTTHTFAPRHRSTVLRDAYRDLRYGMGAVAFNRGNYSQALQLFQSALKPPVSLGVDDFQFQSTPRAYYYIGRTLEALGRKKEATAAYREGTRGIEFLTGDRDSWSPDNFFAVLSLERLGEMDKAKSLIPHFEAFAKTEMNESNPIHRGRARYVLALIAKSTGDRQRARTLLTDALQAMPDFLQPRYELRGDALDPLVKGKPTDTAQK